MSIIEYDIGATPLLKHGDDDTQGEHSGILAREEGLEASLLGRSIGIDRLAYGIHLGTGILLTTNMGKRSLSLRLIATQHLPTRTLGDKEGKHQEE